MPVACSFAAHRSARQPSPHDRRTSSTTLPPHKLQKLYHGAATPEGLELSPFQTSVAAKVWVLVQHEHVLDVRPLAQHAAEPAVPARW